MKRLQHGGLARFVLSHKTGHIWLNYDWLGSQNVFEMVNFNS